MIKNSNRIIEDIIEGTVSHSVDTLAAVIVHRMQENNPRLVSRLADEGSVCVTSSLNLREDISTMAWKKLPPTIRKRVDVKKLQQFLAMLDGNSSFDAAVSAVGLTPALGADLMVALNKTGLL